MFALLVGTTGTFRVAIFQIDFDASSRLTAAMRQCRQLFEIKHSSTMFT